MFVFLWSGVCVCVWPALTRDWCAAECVFALYREPAAAGLVCVCVAPGRANAKWGGGVQNINAHKQTYHYPRHIQHVHICCV